MYYTHPGCWTSIFGENRAYCIRDFTVNIVSANQLFVGVVFLLCYCDVSRKCATIFESVIFSSAAWLTGMAHIIAATCRDCNLTCTELLMVSGNKPKTLPFVGFIGRLVCIATLPAEHGLLAIIMIM